MTNKEDIFYEGIEKKLEEMKQKPPKEQDKKGLGERVNTVFTVALGLVIILGLVVTLIGLLR